MFAAGTVLAGKYRVDRVLGQGGMGTVLAATHLTLGQPVALKLLLAEYLHNAPIVERFVREARASAALRGEHVCRVSDVGALEDGSPYIVMELLEGSDLASLVAAHGPLPVSLACDYVLQACVGVAEAHALSIVHRDLKPANLFLTQRPDGTPLVKVLDFGIAKAQGDTSFHLTRTTSVMGSPGYMSPEQLRSSRDVDARSDIWSLGVILYELVTGTPPFRAESITELAIRVTVDPTPPLVGPMPQGFDEVVRRCLAKDPAQRYPDLAHLAHALAAYAGPGGQELASQAARLLSGPRPSISGMAPLVMPRGSTAMAPLVASRAVPPTHPTPAPAPAPHGTGPGTGTGPIQPVSHGTGPGPGTGTGTGPLPSAHDAPTTLGSATGAVATEHAGRSLARWGIIAGTALAVIGVVVAIAVTRGGDRATPAAPAAPADPAPQPATADPPDAAQPAVAPPSPAPDAALAATPPDAAAGSAATEPGPPQQPDRTGQPPGARTGKPPARTGGEDFGESRY